MTKKTSFILVTFLSLIINVNSQTFDSILANKLQYKIDSIAKANNLKGISACVIYPGVGKWKGVTGLSHGGSPITSDMEFGIGSNTKLFTGVLLLKLAENSIINLDDSIYNYLPNFNNINPNITIRQLLNHTSGLAEVNNVIGYSDSVLTNPNRIFTPTEVLKWVGTPLFSPGTSWNYCNTNYILAGLIAESATGKSYSKLLRDSILSPLQLDSTFLGLFDSIQIPIAHPWQGGMDKFSIPRISLHSIAWSSGAMYSTSDEMAQWYNALMNGKILNQKSFNELITFVGSSNYGIGLYSTNVLGRTVWQHGGTIWGGYNSSMIYDTSTGIIISILINQNPAQAFQISVQLLSTLINNTVGLLENSSPEKLITIYPNPTNDSVNIEIPNQVIKRIQVYNFQGQLINEITESQVNLSNYSTGTYYLNVQTEQGFYNYKLIKQ